MKPATVPPRRFQNGIALLALLAVIGVIGLFFFINSLSSYGLKLARDAADESILNQAKAALIGFAATYRDAHTNEVFGFLPCPDADNNGQAEGGCEAKDISVIGRLPWETLGLPASRDSGNECLWYALSGHAKNNPKTTVFNWDTTGQFVIQDSSGNTLAGANAHERPLAVILAPRSVIGAQDRSPAGISECGGNNTVAAYLDGADSIYTGTVPGADAITTLTLATAESARVGANNDHGLWITSKDIFDPIKKRSDFKTDIDALIGDLQACLNNMSSLPARSPEEKGVTNVVSACPAIGEQKENVQAHWKDNLLYTGPVSGTTVNGATGCNAVLLFGGERTIRTVAPLVAQTRATLAEKGVGSFGEGAMYLEGINAMTFPAADHYIGATHFNSTSASSDIVRCIVGLPPGATQVSFSNSADFSRFVAAGAGVAPVSLPSGNVVTITDAAGSAGGCFWFPDTVPLAGKTLRAFYRYRFSQADTFAVTGSGADRGYGITFQMVRNDLGSPTSICGTESNMGALALGASPGDMWGMISYTLENDIYKTSGHNDPGQNHTAIMAYGNLTHSATNGKVTLSCDGTEAGCANSPANKFEDAPAPASYGQRIEIATGCNSTCSACNPASHLPPSTHYAKIAAWVDCQECDDVSADLIDVELIGTTADKDFSAPGNWTGVNWLNAGGHLAHAAGVTSATLPNSALSRPQVPGQSYRVNLSATTTAAGTLRISFGGTSSTPVSLAVGGPLTLSVKLSAASSGLLTIEPDAVWEGSIDDVSIRLVRTPTISRCVAVDTELNSFYFALTGGFRSGAAVQGVSISDFILRTE